jgi:hypothetical protein
VDESFVAARDERLFWTGYGGRQGLVYIGEKLAAGVKISLLGVSLQGKTEWLEKLDILVEILWKVHDPIERG